MRKCWKIIGRQYTSCKSMVYCALGFVVPTVSAASSKTPRSRIPKLLSTLSRLTETAAPRNRTQLRPENSYLLHRGFTCLVCDDLLEHKKPIGGPGLTVQIDETMVYRHKNHKGNIVPQDWVICGVCVEKKESFMCYVSNRTAYELYECCRDWINPQSHIVTDCWRAYPEVTRRLQASSHQTVNHSSNFVDPKTGACTNHVKGFWSVFKRWLHKRDCFTGSRKMLDLYMGEFL